jgi:hypothetical protein
MVKCHCNKNDVRDSKENAGKLSALSFAESFGFVLNNNSMYEKCKAQL